MKCAFALLVDDQIHNYVKNIAFKINKIIDNGFMGSLLPPHVSLKQPFDIEDINQIENYFDQLSSSISPILLKIGPTYLWESIIGLNVCETVELRNCHNKINNDLKSICENPIAQHDGDGYHFHLTIACYGKEKSEYEKAYNQIKDETIMFNVKSNRIAMFYYDDNKFSLGSFIVYKINEIQ